jgi:hypothetical protein
MAPAGRRARPEPRESHQGYARQRRLAQRLRRIEGGAPSSPAHGGGGAVLHRRPRPVSAMTKELQSVPLGLLDEHLDHCVGDAVAGGGVAHAKPKEALGLPSPVSCSPEPHRSDCVGPTLPVRHQGCGTSSETRQEEPAMSTSTDTVAVMTPSSRPCAFTVYTARWPGWGRAPTTPWSRSSHCCRRTSSTGAVGRRASSRGWRSSPGPRTPTTVDDAT